MPVSELSPSRWSYTCQDAIEPVQHMLLDSHGWRRSTLRREMRVERRMRVRSACRAVVLCGGAYMTLLGQVGGEERGEAAVTMAIRSSVACNSAQVGGVSAYLGSWPSLACLAHWDS